MLGDHAAGMDPKLLARIKAVTAKRPRTVLDHILKHGRVTTDELKNIYGYSHPPRAARDVRECGIPLKTTSVTGPDGRPMAAYTIDENADLGVAKAGRQALPKAMKDDLVLRHGAQCALCGGHFPGRALQADHRIPYEIAGETEGLDLAAFMPVCGSCNRAKSWSCEHCPNWQVKSVDMCRSCMWASPETYSHIATVPRRRLDIVWESEEVQDYDQIAAEAKHIDVDVRVLIKGIIRRSLGRDSGS